MVILKAVFILLAGLVIRLNQDYIIMSIAAWFLFLLSAVWIYQEKAYKPLSDHMISMYLSLFYIAFFHAVIILEIPGI
jgi:hypothetical protein